MIGLSDCRPNCGHELRLEQPANVVAMLTNFSKPLFTTSFIGQHGGSIRDFKRNEALYAQGDRAYNLFYVLSGYILLAAVATDGKESLVELLEPGQFFGTDCFNLVGERKAAAVAATKCTIAAFPSDGVVHIINAHHGFVASLFASTLVQNYTLKEALVDIMSLSSEMRLARLLLKLAPLAANEDAALIDLPMSQEMLAKLVGASRPRVSVLLNKFRRLGHIEYKGHLPGRVKVYSSLNSIVGDFGMPRLKRKKLKF